MLGILALAACDTGDGRTLREPTAQQRTAMTTSTTSTTVIPTLPGALATTTTLPALFTLQAPWVDGGAIDVRFSCDGEGRSPQLIWSLPPIGTVELALVVTDDDAPGFVHWAVAGLPPTAGQLAEGGPVTGIEGVNGAGAPGYTGPCPPAAGETHTYRISLYALNQQTELPDDFTGQELLDLATTTGIASAEVTGTYTRVG